MEPWKGALDLLSIGGCETSQQGGLNLPWALLSCAERIWCQSCAGDRVTMSGCQQCHVRGCGGDSSVLAPSRGRERMSWAEIKLGLGHAAPLDEVTS